MHQKQVVADMLISNLGMPVFWQHSVDLTPVKLRQHAQSQGGGLRYQGSGKTTKELLVQQVFLSTSDRRGRRVHGILFKEAVELEFGKTASALASCVLECPGLSLRAVDSHSIIISHQVGDRGGSKQLRHVVSGQRAKTMHESRAGASNLPVEDVVTHWSTSVGCAAHDLHNSLRWAHQVVFNHPKEVLSNLYAAMATFKGSQVMAVRHLGQWLQRVVVCHNPVNPNLTN